MTDGNTNLKNYTIMKKNLLFLLFALLPMVASADPVEIDGIYYNLITKAKQAEEDFSDQILRLSFL